MSITKNNIEWFHKLIERVPEIRPTGRNLKKRKKGEKMSIKISIIKPSIKIVTPTNHIKGMLKRIEKIGRTCYKSENKINDVSAKKFIKQIMTNQHFSVIEHESISVRVICDRGVSHEFVRHRIASYSQESTRYVNYQKKGFQFIKPDFAILDEDIKILQIIATHYNRCLERGHKPQAARYFLPNGLKTEFVVTMNLRSWLHFFELRTSKKAHPQMQEIAFMILEKFQQLLPEIFCFKADETTEK